MIGWCRSGETGRPAHPDSRIHAHYRSTEIQIALKTKFFLLCKTETILVHLQYEPIKRYVTRTALKDYFLKRRE